MTITASAGFLKWLRSEGVSLALTTYQAEKLFLLGLAADGSLSAFERTLDRVLGMCVDQDQMWLATKYQIWRFSNALGPGQLHDGYDRVYLPRSSVITGDLETHDLAVEDSGRLVFVNTMFNCLATVADHYSFEPIWTPPWISGLAPEDRCHLNGLALRDGKARYVSSICKSDQRAGWRENVIGAGVIVDVTSHATVCSRLTMPHSPRWHHGELFILDSGRGYLSVVDRDRALATPICFLPGFARGLAFHNHWAVVGLSRRRDDRKFSQLPLADTLAHLDRDTECGIHIVDLRTGKVAHWLRVDGVVNEIYDVAVLPGVRRPMAVGFKTDEVERMISHPPLHDSVVSRHE